MQYPTRFKALILSSLISFGCQAGPSSESALEQAVLNATYITTVLKAVDPLFVRTAIENIAKGDIVRPVPENPLWILESDAGTILYYEGKADFVNQAANQLVDDDGQRFGQVALERARRSQGGWSKIKLAGRDYTTYCHSLAPYVVCNLIP